LSLKVSVYGESHSFVLMLIYALIPAKLAVYSGVIVILVKLLIKKKKF